MATTERPPVADRLAVAGELRDEGIAAVENAADPRVILAIDARIQQAIDARRPFSANDIRDDFPVSDEHLVGARIRAFGNKRIEGQRVMAPIGYTPSTLASTHKHPIRVWVGCTITSQEPPA